MVKVALGALLSLFGLAAIALVEARIGNGATGRQLQLPQLQNVFPLKICQGDCDYDSDCEAGLVCFQRSAKDPVPGCQDGGEGFFASVDYCINPAALVTVPPTMTNMTESSMNMTESSMNMTGDMDTTMNDVIEDPGTVVQAEGMETTTPGQNATETTTPGQNATETTTPSQNATETPMPNQNATTETMPIEPKRDNS